MTAEIFVTRQNIILFHKVWFIHLNFYLEELTYSVI